MNKDLQAIMERRRRMAEGGEEEVSKQQQNAQAREQGPPAVFEESLTDLHASASDLRASKSNMSSTSFDLNMSNDLQAIMERRRRLADGDGAMNSPTLPISPRPQQIVDTPPVSSIGSPNASSTPLNESLKSFQMSADLQAIMERRRRMAGGDAEEQPNLNDIQQRRASTGGSSAHFSKEEEQTDPVDNVPSETQPVPRTNRRMSAFGRLSSDSLSDDMELDKSAKRREKISRQSTREDDKPVKREEEAISRHSYRGGSRHTKRDELSSRHSSRGGEPMSRAATVQKEEDHEQHHGEISSMSRRSRREGAIPKHSTRRSRATSSRHQIRETEPDDSDASGDSFHNEETVASLRSEFVAEEKERNAVGEVSTNSTGIHESQTFRDISEDEVSSSDEELEQAGPPTQKEDIVINEEHQVPQQKPVFQDEDGPLPASQTPRKTRHMTKRPSKKDLHDGETSIAPSVDSSKESVNSASKSRRVVSNRIASRRSSTGSSDEDITSLRALRASTKQRRSSTTGSVFSDELSRASGNSGDSGSGRKSRSSRKEPMPTERRRRARRKSNSGSSIAEEGSSRRRAASTRSTTSYDPEQGRPTRQSLRQSESFESDESRPSDSQDQAPPEEAGSGWDANAFTAQAMENSFANLDSGFTDAHNFASDFANFGGGNSTFPSMPITNTNEQNVNMEFDAAFSAPSAFGSSDLFGMSQNEGAMGITGNKGDPSFDNLAFGGESDGFDAFQLNPFNESVSKQAERKDAVFESSPLSNPPVFPAKKISMVTKTLLKANFKSPPVSNPLNGNIFVCTICEGNFVIREVNPYRNCMQVACVTVLSPELRRKICSRYNATLLGVGSVVNLTAGLHKAHGQVRLRVAAVVDLTVMESSQDMRVVVVWQWGYGSVQPIALQHAMTPPSGGDFLYDATSLQVADNLLFLAGSSPKGPCIFISKPAVRETWTVHFTNTNGRIITMAVSPDAKRSYPYLAIACSDRTISVWTYSAALVSASKDKETGNKWLFPRCRLECASVFANLEVQSISEDFNSSGKDLKDSGHCTSLAWLPPRPSSSPFPLLAAGFQNALAVFLVELPIKMDSRTMHGFSPVVEPDSNATLSQSPAIFPMLAKRWLGKHEQSFVSWLDFGPHYALGISVLLHGGEISNGTGRLLIGLMDIPHYRRGPKLQARLVSFRILSSVSISRASDLFPLSLLPTPGLNGILYRTDERLVKIFMSTSADKRDNVVSRARLPITNQPTGLSSTGETLLSESMDEKDGVLHIYTVHQFERTKHETDPALLVWDRPYIRYWLCRTVAGDTKATAVEDAKEDKDFDVAEQALGGATTESICDLCHEKLDGLVPCGIRKAAGRPICAVLFKPNLGMRETDIMEDSVSATKVALVDLSGNSAIMSVLDGRDIAFFPAFNGSPASGFILSVDGSMLSLFTVLKDCTGIKIIRSHRPLLGTDPDESYIETQRIFLFHGANKITLAVAGVRHHDGRACFVTGSLDEIKDFSEIDWFHILPNIVEGRAIWFNDEEAVLSAVGLQCDDSGYRNYGVATTSRVLILSSSLTVCAEAACVTTSLSPIGSFALCYCSGIKIDYLSCLDSDLSRGCLLNLPTPKLGYSDNALLALRPDRCILVDIQTCSRYVELNQSSNTFPLPCAKTVPALLLEPMVANAICLGGKQAQSTPILRTVIEKFGRKMTSLAHGEDEGIGNLGAGLSPRVFQFLEKYGLKHPSSWLLTGVTSFDRSANSKLAPPWLPLAPKGKGALSADAFLHLFASGDPYFSEYIKSPDQNIASTLPKTSDPCAAICKEFAGLTLHSDEIAGKLKVLDVMGSESVDNWILQMLLIIQQSRAGDATNLLKSMSGFDEGGLLRSNAPSRAPIGLAGLTASLMSNKGQVSLSRDAVERWVKPLAPSLQRGARLSRSRQKLFGESALNVAGDCEECKADTYWMTPCNEAKHVWNEGPRKEKQNLLMLDKVEDWLGRRRPLVLGKDGAVGGDRGEKTLADILNQEDDDSFGGKSDLESARDDGWVDGIGEGRSDEANLSAYFRFSEGEDEDSSWRSDGLQDLSPFQNRAAIIGDADSFNLQVSTSSVDEGDPGKVKSLYDLVFEKSGDGRPSGLALSACRGGSLDIGVLHVAKHSSRTKCTVEFWYYLPEEGSVTSEIVLVRRTMGSCADDFSAVCNASDRASVLWELAVLRSGSLEFRTCGGSRFLSTQDSDVSSAVSQERKDLAGFGRWNHVCVVLTSRDKADIVKCDVSMYMKGEEVTSGEASMLPPGFDQDDLSDESVLDSILQKSHLVFGLNHAAGFRLTELRIWACERSSDDTKTFLYEYLTAAEAKKKFKVKISNKKKGATLGKGTFLAPPKGAETGQGKGILSGPKSGVSILAPSRKAIPSNEGIHGISLAPPPQGEQSETFSLAPPTTPGVEKTASKSFQGDVFETTFESFPAPSEANSRKEFENAADQDGFLSTPQPFSPDPIGEEVQNDVPASLWETALPLSKQVRASAAAAIIRGPPATRHFGGNRGGLPDFIGMDRTGVGGIAICGSEKTIVWRDNEDPPALTYPIGASGAVVSDRMDDAGSEFLCCFLAKEKRMVVFELQSRTVVVELQMTTKLNFWRYLPPEAGENTLCFMLITPMGGFHWMPLEESPRPHQVWKRGPDLQGKKIVTYEEGGSNGLDGHEMLSSVGLIMVTRATGGGFLEAWLIPIAGDSEACQVSDDVMGACLCQPTAAEDGAFLPMLITVHDLQEGIYVNIMSIVEPRKGSVRLGELVTTQVIEMEEFEDLDLEPPALAMGTFPEAICCSLANIVVVIIRRKGLIAAFELDGGELSLIAQEGVGHYVVDAVMRYSEEVGGAEIVMILSDNENPKDGRMVSFCFRSAA